MKKIKEMIERHNTEKTAKKHGRNFSQQKYRNQLATELKTERKKGRLKAADELLKREKGTDQYVSSLFDGRIPGKNEIKLIIQQGFLDYVCNNIMQGKFKGIDEEIAYDLLKSGCFQFVASQLDKFEGADHGKIAEYFFEHGQGDFVAIYLYNFKGLDHKEIAEKLIQRGEGEYVVNNIEKFEGLDHKEIAKKLIQRGGWRYVTFPAKFEGLDKEMAEMLIKKGKMGFLILNLNAFKGLDEEIAKKLIEAGCGDIVEEFPEKFGLKK